MRKNVNLREITELVSMGLSAMYSTFSKAFTTHSILKIFDKSNNECIFVGHLATKAVKYHEEAVILNLSKYV